MYGVFYIHSYTNYGISRKSLMKVFQSVGVGIYLALSLRSNVIGTIHLMNFPK